MRAIWRLASKDNWNEFGRRRCGLREKELVQ